MKLKLILILLIICTAGNTFGQRKKIIDLNNFDKTKIRYGYYLGIHFKGYELKANDNVEITQGPGFQLGVLADLNISKYTSIIAEPGIISTTNKLTIDDRDLDIPTTHFHLPISLKFNTKRINNVRTYFSIGASYNYNFSAEKNKGDGGADPYDFELTKHNIMGEIVLGANFYLPYFKFSPSLRGIYGFNNEFNGLGDIAKNSIKSLKSRGVFVTLTFQ